MLDGDDTSAVSACLQRGSEVAVGLENRPVVADGGHGRGEPTGMQQHLRSTTQSEIHAWNGDGVEPMR